jgi:spore coat protein U-like protein
MMPRIVLAALPQLAVGAQKAAAQLSSISAASMNLETYSGRRLDGGGTPLTVTGLLTFDVGLNQGTGAGATTTTREMTGSGGTESSYQIFQKPTNAANRGDNYGSDKTGCYSDTIIATLSY